jgi:hypothetical protein
VSKYVCINLVKRGKVVLSNITLHSSLVDYLAQVMNGKKISQPFIFLLFIWYGLVKSFDQQNLFLFPKYFLKDQNYFGQSKKTTAKMSIL